MLSPEALKTTGVSFENGPHAQLEHDASEKGLSVEGGSVSKLVAWSPCELSVREEASVVKR